MKLKKFVKVTKAKRFEVFVYPEGYTKSDCGLDCEVISQFVVSRDEKGNIIKTKSYEDFKNCKVTEAIPWIDGINVVAEIGDERDE